jgi:hypothetical protein
MGECVVTRKQTHGSKPLEYRTKEGTWSSDASLALQCSEEDAKAIVRTLEQADRPPAVFTYDHAVVSE